MTDQESIAALHRWPRILALAFIGHHDGKPRVTWQEFCEAQDRFDDILSHVKGASMVGGKVIEVRLEGGKARLWVMDTGQYADEAAVYVEMQPEMPAPGDDVWWQGRNAYWTPADRRFTDRPLPRIGYSFQPTN